MLMKNHRPGQAKQADQPQAEEQPKAADQAKAADQPQPEEQPKKVNQSERHLQSRFEKFPHALKHGAFSALSILPGEDEKEFMELHQSIAAELLPDGPIENDAVKTIAVCMWRASHLTIFRRAQWARAKYGEDLRIVPETEPARSHYKELVEAKANVRACQVLQDIGQGMLETQLEAVNNVATEMTMAGLEEFQKDVQVINSAAFQCLPVAAVNLVSRVFGARRIGDPLPIALENAAKALGASESEAKRLSDDAMVAPKQRKLHEPE